MNLLLSHRPSCRGFTLLEVVVVLTLLGLAASHLLPAARAGLDRVAVLSAREELAGLFHLTRQTALGHDGVVLSLKTAPPEAYLIVGEDTVAGGRLTSDPSLSMSLSRERSDVALRFGPLGLGLVSSQSIRFQRGVEEAVLVVSGLGRVSRR